MGFAICQNPKFIFIHIPKTGGTSLFSTKSPVKNQLSPHCKGLEIGSGHRYLRNYLNLKDFSSYKILTIVRNPYDRFISLWKVRRSDISLSSFIRLIKSRKLSWYALKPQYVWVSDRSRNVVVDHLMRFENLQEDINKVFQTIGLPPIDLPHLCKTNRTSGYKQYYKQKSDIEFVNNYYAKDLLHFNYTF